MQVTLRKADALSRRLLDAAKKIELKPGVELSIYGEQAPKSAADGALSTLKSNLTTYTSYVTAAYAIRDALSLINVSAGVSKRLAEKNSLNMQEAVLVTLITGAREGVEVAGASAKRDSLRTRAAAADSGYGLVEALDVRVIDSEYAAELDERLHDVRRRKQEIADELLALNTSTSVALDTATLAALQSARLV